VTEAVAEMIGAQRAGTGEAFLHSRTCGFCQSVLIDVPRRGAFGWDGGLGTSRLVDARRNRW
jgi:hypothetical protein